MSMTRDIIIPSHYMARSRYMAMSRSSRYMAMSRLVTWRCLDSGGGFSLPNWPVWTGAFAYCTAQTLTLLYLPFVLRNPQPVVPVLCQQKPSACYTYPMYSENLSLLYLPSVIKLSACCTSPLTSTKHEYICEVRSSFVQRSQILKPAL